MKKRLGVAVGAAEVRAVLIESHVIRWHAAAPFHGVDSLAECLRQIVERVPPPFSRPRVSAVLSPAWVQVRQLHGFPSVTSRQIANQVVRENQQAFFLWKGTPTAIADVHRGSDGAPWGAAFDKRAVEELTRALRGSRFPVSRVAPTLVVLVASIPNTAIAWGDGGDRFSLEGDVNGLRRAERIESDTPVQWFNLPLALTALGDDAPRFFDAYAAAMVPRPSLCWRVGSDEPHSRRFARARNATMAAVIGGATAFAALGPGVRAARFARVAKGEIARDRGAQSEMRQSQAELRRVTQTLNSIESFRAQRGRATQVLGELSRVLPESTAMLSFHVDSIEGAFTAIAPHVADVLPEMATVSQIVAPRIVGSVTRELFGGVPIERATFRFHRKAPTKPGSPRPAR